MYEASLENDSQHWTDWADEPGRSSHIELTVDGCAVASYRMTECLEPNKPNGSIIRDWTFGRSPLPSGADVIEWTRCVVSPDWRGYSLFEFAAHDMLARARKANNKQFVTAIAQTAFSHIDRVLQRVGFQRVKCPFAVFCSEVPGRTLDMQPYVYDLQDARVLDLQLKRHEELKRYLEPLGSGAVL